MRGQPRGAKAAKQTVSLTINSDLYAQVKAFGINASQVAEQALSDEVSRRVAEQIRAEIVQDLEAAGSYVEKHGSFADLVREHYRDEAND